MQSDAKEPDASDVECARRNLRDILEFAFEYDESQRTLVVYDTDSELARILTAGYRACLPAARFLVFQPDDPAEVLAAFEELGSGDLAVLVQSTSFRLHAFRIRMELFRRGLAVLEHPHLSRMQGEEVQIYLEALAYDPSYLRIVGPALKARIDDASTATIETGGATLVFSAGLEPAKLNIGDYRDMRNVGGQYPIGEVFTESKELESVSGKLRIASFGDSQFHVNRPPQPITLVIEAGRIVATEDGTPALDQVLASIRKDEGEVWVLELGFGLNRALTTERMVSDIGTYERMCGIHLSIGSKHASYNKPQIKKRKARHHVDVFAATESVRLDDEVVFRDGAWLVPSAGG